MPFTLEEILSSEQVLRTVQHGDSVLHAINLMHQHNYSQLPVVGSDGKVSLDEVVTFDGILQATRSFATTCESLQVKDVARPARSYSADADLLATLDDIQRDNFALIVDEKGLLTGIVTTADTTVFFREYAQDLMQIEGIELRIKEAIQSLYAFDETQLTTTIEEITDRARDIRRKIPAAIRGFLEKCGQDAALAENQEGLIEAERRLSLPKPGKAFDQLSFDEFTQVLLRHSRAPKLAGAPETAELRRLLEQVRDSRNKLAHFRGELSAEERRSIQYAATWLDRNLPVLKVVPPAAVVRPPKSSSDDDHEDGEPKGSYSGLAEHLRAQDSAVTSLTMSFQEIGRLLSRGLPRSAFEYRAWWANDPGKPQSSAWLDEGWRTGTVRMTEKQLTFVRTNERANAYIKFFAALQSRLRDAGEFPIYNISPKGANWQVLTYLSAAQTPQGPGIFVTFTRTRELRVELYMDLGDIDATKSRFDELYSRKLEIENLAGQALQWERRDNHRSSRIAICTAAQIQGRPEESSLVEWAAKRAISIYRAFHPEFSRPRSVR